MRSAVSIHRATPADMPALRVLLLEMGHHYGERTDDATIEAAATVLTDPQGRAGPHCLLAAQRGRPAGLAVLSGFFPAFDFTWGLLLKDLFVAATARGGSMARALMTAAAGFAVEEEFTRLDWTTDAGNARARAFYAACGVPAAAKVFYRIEGAVLAGAALGTWPDRLEGTAA